MAAVVGDGATNREPAARLYISRHTVVYHLPQIFRKLDIPSRVDLASRRGQNPFLVYLPNPN